MKLSPNMLKTLQNLQRGKVTAFGYTFDTLGPTFLNGHSVKALIARGLLESCGEVPWQTYMDGGDQRGHYVPVYRISEAGRQILKGEDDCCVHPLKISDAQRSVLQAMAENWSLHSEYEVEKGETRLGNSPSLWPEHFFLHSRYKSVLPSTLQALLRLSLVEEERRYMSGNSVQGDRQWERWTIVYRLSEKGKDLIGVPRCYLCGKEAESQCPDCGKWICYEDRRDFPPDFDEHLCYPCVGKRNDALLEK